MAASEDVKLPELFDKIWKSYQYLDKTDEPTIADNVQGHVKEATNDAERAIFMINKLRLFSTNEEIDEVATNEIKYMLLSALMGYLLLKDVKPERIKVVQQAQVHFVDFLRLCKDYGLTHIDLASYTATEDSTDACDSGTNPGTPQISSGSQEGVMALAKRRQHKIQRFRQQKEVEAKLAELYPLVEREHVDDELKREYYFTLLKRWINMSVEELDAIRDEIPLLEQMARMRASGKGDVTSSKPPARSAQSSQLRPFIITKTDLQKKVLGLGYPSMPTYTVEEFFDQQLQQGRLPDQGPSRLQGSGGPDAEAAAQEQRAVEAEDQVDRDDPEALQKARDWDDWKDDHRRGWGNTQNKG